MIGRSVPESVLPAELGESPVFKEHNSSKKRRGNNNNNNRKKFRKKKGNQGGGHKGPAATGA